MREVNFRTIDKLFIKMSINDKFWVIGALFFIAITCIGVSRYQGSIDAIEQASMTALESELSGMVRALETSGQTDKFTSLNIQPSGQASSSRSQDSVTAVVRSAAGQNLSLTQNVASRERDAKQSALYSLLLTYLWLLPFAVLLYWNATFIGGALWVLWTTTKNIAKGDLTSRLGFHPGRDEFGTIGCALDNAMDTLTELVVTVKDNAETLHHTASSFASENQESERQIEQQYQSLDSVATAMEEMTASAGEVSNISNSSVEKVEQNSQSIRQSYERVQKAIKDIEQLSGFIEQTSDSVSTLKVNATKINEVITTINAISEQTNLLALNAAIEEIGRAHV